METINYVLCAWSGDRRVPDERREQTPYIYLSQHIKSLCDLRHQIAQISIMVPDNPSEPLSYREFLKSVPSSINGAKVVIHDRPNVGLSYGSLSDCYGMYRTSFSHYIMMEDDYQFCLDDFDDICLSLMKKHPGCGYVCQQSQAVFGWPLHASRSNGLLLTEALEKVWRANGFLPHGGSAVYTDCELYGQVMQSQAIVSHGYGIIDVLEEYSVRSRCNDFTMGIETIGDSSRPVLMEPV